MQRLVECCWGTVPVDPAASAAALDVQQERLPWPHLMEAKATE